MKKFSSKIIACIAAAFTLFCVGCEKCDKDDVIIVPDPSKKLVESGYFLVDGGMSEYSIALPSEPKADEYTAATELQTFLSQSSGAVLPIVSDKDIADDAPVISIGDTSFAAARGITAEGMDLGSSAYKIKTADDSLFILADEKGTGEGCVYAVYDLLADAIGWCAYAADEFDYEEKERINLYVYDDVIRPTFDRRAIAYLDINSNAVYRRRMRFISQYNNDFWCNPLFGHSQISVLLKTEKYFEQHKYSATKTDYWYSNAGGQQLCYTGGADMEKEMATVLYEYIKAYPNATYFMLGQEDNKGYCTCERCLNAINEWGCNQTGLEINFINNVISIIDEWVKRDYPSGRDIKYVMFAYFDALVPPVTDDGNGNYKAYSDKVVPDDDLYVYFTPIETDYSRTLEDIENEDILKNLNGWSQLLEKKDRLIVYTYDTNFHYYFYNFNNFHTFQSQLKTYSENGVNYAYTQGAVWTNQCTFQEMRIFIESNLMWNIDLSYDDLANKFMKGYYKDAAAAIRKYYDFIRMRYEYCEKMLDMSFTSIYSDIGSKDIWTASVVSAMDGIFNEAYESIAHYKTDKPDMYKTLTNRIKRLELTLIYTKMKNYRSDYSQAEVNSLVDDFNKYTSLFQITDYKENNGAVAGLFDAYRK